MFTEMSIVNLQKKRWELHAEPILRIVNFINCAWFGRKIDFFMPVDSEVVFIFFFLCFSWILCTDFSVLCRYC